jgi:hypothetical protein
MLCALSAPEDEPLPPLPARFCVRPKPGRPHNRVRLVMLHGWRFSCLGTEGLAAVLDLHPATVRRILAGDVRPSAPVMEHIAAALSEDLIVPLTPEDLFAEVGPDGNVTYAEPNTCRLCGCDGCLPEEAYDPRGRRRPEWVGVRPGTWATVAVSGLPTDIQAVSIPGQTGP